MESVSDRNLTMKNRLILCGIFLLCLFTKMLAEGISVNPYFQSHMVLQQAQPIVVWGTAAPNSVVKGSFDDESVSALADAEGKWQLTFKARKASFAPKKMTIGDKVFTDILIGEVWVCAGQSNMVWMVRNCNKDTKNLPKEPSFYDGFRILHFIGGAPLTANNGYTDEQLARCNTETFFEYKWEQPTFNRLMDYSAVSTHFGLELRKQLQVPVGIITTAMGGSPIAAWIPSEEVKKFPKVASWYGKDWLTNKDLDYGTKHWAKVNFKRVLPNPPVYILGEFPYHHLWEPGFLFDASHKKIGKAKIKGVVWYQGETDAISQTRIDDYKVLFPMLAQSFRDNYGNPNLPFINVQLPNFSDKHWPQMRAVQEMLTHEDKHAFMVPLIDNGELRNIHYTNKIDVGKRVAYRVVDNIYHKADYAFPEIKYYRIKNGEMEIVFSDVDKQLKFSLDKPAMVEVTDVEGKKDSVQVKIAGSDKIKINVAGASKIKSVRYAYKNCVLNESLLLSADNIPVPPFEICPKDTKKKVKYFAK